MHVLGSKDSIIMALGTKCHTLQCCHCYAPKDTKRFLRALRPGYFGVIYASLDHTAGEKSKRIGGLTEFVTVLAWYPPYQVRLYTESPKKDQHSNNVLFPGQKPTPSKRWAVPVSSPLFAYASNTSILKE